MEENEIKEMLANAVTFLNTGGVDLKYILFKVTSIIDIVKTMPGSSHKQGVEYGAKCVKEEIKKFANDLLEYAKKKEIMSYPSRDFLLLSAEDVGKAVEYLLKTFIWLLF